MASENNDAPNISVSVPFGVIAAGALLLAGSVAAYILNSRSENGVLEAVKEKGKAKKGFGKKLGLMTLITLIENDTTRKLVVAVLRAMARRA